MLFLNPTKIYKMTIWLYTGHFQSIMRDTGIYICLSHWLIIPVKLPSVHNKSLLAALLPLYCLLKDYY